MTTQLPAISDNYQFNRRRLLVGAAATLVCAPAIVRPVSLMPIRQIVVTKPEPVYMGFVDRLRFHWMEQALRRGWDEVRDGQTFGGVTEAQARRFVDRARSEGWIISVETCKGPEGLRANSSAGKF